MKKLYVVRTEYLNKNMEIVQGECWYEGFDLKEAFKKYEAYRSAYTVDKSKRQYASDIYYDYIYIMCYTLDRDYDLEDRFDRDELFELMDAQDLMNDPMLSNDMTLLKQERILAGLSQSQLSEAAGVPLRTLQDYEQRKRDLSKASFTTVSKLADALKCSPDYLIK